MSYVGAPPRARKSLVVNDLRTYPSEKGTGC